MEELASEWEEYIIPEDQVNQFALTAFLPLALIVVLPFWLIHGGGATGQGFMWIIKHPLRLIGLMVVGTLIHEGLHALGWVLFARISFKEMKFGILKGNPYTHVKVPLPARAYQLGTALPGIMLGVVPGLISWVNSNGVLMLFGAIMLTAAAGDAIMLWLLREVPPDRMVKDHPSAIGCLVKKE